MHPSGLRTIQESKRLGLWDEIEDEVLSQVAQVTQVEIGIVVRFSKKHITRKSCSRVGKFELSRLRHLSLSIGIN